MKKFWDIFLWLIIILFWGCAQEDPNLVNPPLPSETIRLRFFNAVDNPSKLQLDIDGRVRSSEIGYLDISDTITPPPNDSISLALFVDGNRVYQSSVKLRLVRNTRYIIIAGETSSSNGIPDTTLVLYSTIGLPKNQFQSYFKFVNLVKDTNARFSIVEGCPNGRVVVQSQRYLAFPNFQTIVAGNHIFSIIEEQEGSRQLVGLYSIDFDEDKEYTLFLVKDKIGAIRLYKIWDYDNSQSPLVEVAPLLERTTHIRIVNFSNVSVSISKIPNYPIASNVEPLFLSKYYSVPACESDILDSLELVFPSGIDYITYPLEVNKRYSILLFGKDKIENSLFVPPITLREKIGTKSLIRVVNATNDSIPITLSVGARSSTKQLGYVMGEILASNISRGQISDAVVIEPGFLPLTLFSSMEPSYLIKPTYTYISPGKNYLFVLFNDQNGLVQLSVIEDDEQDTELNLTEQGFFVQILNVQPYSAQVKVEIPSILGEALLFYEQSLSTVLPSSINTFVVDGDVPVNFINDIQKRGLFIITGDSNGTDVFYDVNFSMGNDRRTYRRRFFNACKDVLSFTIKSYNPNGFSLVSNLSYGSFSPVEFVNTERRLSLFLIDDTNGKVLTQFNDVFLTLGKNYTLVASGTHSKNFSLTVVQEY
ncbi:MAG: hypothetical protein ACUVQ1_03810 [Candidatus Kapaibacteriales bacterium]